VADEALAPMQPSLRFGDPIAARFSRDGRFLALVLVRPERVWICELRSGRLVPATKPDSSLHLTDIAWSQGGILYVIADREGVGPVFFAATVDMTEEINQLPAEMVAIFVDRSKRLHYNIKGYTGEHNDQLAVEIMPRGHGAANLLMRRTASNSWTEIAGGGFELLTFLFDPVRSQVLYPAMFPGRGGIVAFDLRTLQRRTVLLLNNPHWAWLLDQTQDGAIVAYVEAGGCLWERQPVEQLKIDHPSHICLAEFK
jgi:hypothetical protein